MIAAVINSWLFVMQGSWCHVGFDTNNWFDAIFEAFFVKLDCPVHDAVISQSHGGLAVLLNFRHNIRNLANTEKHRKVRVNMEMDKLGKLCMLGGMSKIPD